uniref:Lysosome-associated membrane glycoprotein 1 n=1 Tax=Globodera pallida TaxID=36090 RepID=A0A183C632_GLOPA
MTSQGHGSSIFCGLALCSFALLVFCCGTAQSLLLGVRDHKQGNYCILLEANITGTVQYTDEENVSRSSNFTVPDSAPTETSYNAVRPSHCGKSHQQITIEFVPDGFNHTELEADHTWYLTLQFNSTGSLEQGSYSLSNYTLDVVFFEMQNASSHYNGSHTYTKAPSFKPEWNAAVQQGQPNAFTCSQNALHFVESSVTFQNLKVIAFANETKLEFKEGQITEPCLLDVRTSDLIPIIVGACLAGLVVIVLVAYLVGRARAKRQGYTSV